MSSCASCFLQPRLLCICLILALTLFFTTAIAQITAPKNPTVHSLSGQFIVRAAPGVEARSSTLSNTNRQLVRLQPTLVTISSERIKQLLYYELGAGPAWRGKIWLTLYHATNPEQPVTIVSEKFRDGWQYKVQLPDLLDRVRYVRTIIHVLLLEIANRASEERSAEIPAWLREGLTEQLLAANEIRIILQPPPPAGKELTLVSANVNARRESPLEHAH